MKRMFGEASRPFYDSALMMPLEKPPENDSREFMISHFLDAGLKLKAELANEIMAVSENIPYYLQEMASEVFEEVVLNERDEATADDVSAATKTIIARNAELYELRLSSFSDAKRAIVMALANGPISIFDEQCRRKYALPTGSTLHTALPEIVDSGVVERSEVGYRLADPFFARYLLTPPAKVF